MPARFSPAALTQFATALLNRAGLEDEKSRVVADILVEGDLMGHTTHGLALLPGYLEELEKGSMTKSGSPRVIADFPAAVNWDGQRLPGPWLAVRALTLATERAKQHGTCTVAIQRSHHIACLAAFLRPVTEQGMMAILSCSDPAGSSVSPHGGRKPLYTPNPFAAAWPTKGHPVILDVSMSITTNGLIKRMHTEKKPLPGKWLLDAAGVPTDDPGVMFSEPSGTLLPMGGVDHGHKGYALALFVETITSALAGRGRIHPKEGWGASVFVQVINPAFFGGKDEFVALTSHLADGCRATPPRPGFDRVRVPGEAGLRRREEQLKSGVELYHSIMPSLESWTKKLGIAAPAAM
jgi:LDH2 family malate/lactate/ureidoglycolate dehydrogenase